MTTLCIDSHTHGDPIVARDPTAASGLTARDPQAYVAACRQRGIEAIVLIEPLERCLQAVERFGDFVIPIARIDMDAAGVQEVERCLATNATGRCTRGSRSGAPWPSFIPAT
jgi:hypothetical protein